MDEGKQMSGYGKDKMSLQESFLMWKTIIKKADVIRNRHLSIIGNQSTHWPGIKQWTKDDIAESIKQGKHSLYGSRKTKTVADYISTWERSFYTRPEYDAKMHRDYRKSVQVIGRSFHEEEKRRIVPLLTSSIYGHRLAQPVEKFERPHVRKGHVKKDFFSKNGTGIPPFNDLVSKCQIK